MTLLHNEAAESIDKDILYRSWAAGHGGVYVPATEQTPPNPHLSHVRERDITTPSGRRLTLVNPAYMTRQVEELGRARVGYGGHVTSSRPMRPENKADDWEQKAFEKIEQGAKEYGELVTLNNLSHYRLLKPLFVEQPCLACHAAQGYKVGDLCGGISASIPMSNALKCLKASQNWQTSC